MKIIDFIERNMNYIIMGILALAVFCCGVASLVVYADIEKKYADIEKKYADIENMKVQAESEITEMKAKARHGRLEERLQEYMGVYYRAYDEEDRRVLKEWMMVEFKDIDDAEINDIVIRLFVDQIRREE